MDKNTVIGLILIGLIFIVFSIINKPSKEEMEAARHRADSIAALQQAQQEERAKAFQADSLLKASSPELIKEQAVERQEKFGPFASATEGTPEFITLENDLIRLVISTKGARPYSVQIKKYRRYDSLPLVLFDGDSTVFSLGFYAQNRKVSTQDLIFTPQVNQRTFLATKDSVVLPLRVSIGENKYLEYVYSLKPGSYRVNLDVKTVGLQDVIAQNINSLDLEWQAYIPQLEKGRQNEDNYTTIFYKYAGGDVENLNPRSKKGENTAELNVKVKWVAFKQQFFASVLIADESFANGQVTSVHIPEPSPYLRKFSAVLGVPYNPNADNTIGMSFYFGPNHFTTLKKEGDDLQELVILGKWIVKWINQFVIIPIFNFLNRFISNYGIIILILTIIIKTALLPLTYRSYLSMAKMRVLKPMIDEINARIPKEKAMERQQATMNLYKKAGVNPMGGCLPMLLQFPILFAMFRFFPTSFELRQQGFLWADDLSTYDSIISWSAHIPILSSIYGNHVSLFTILMTVTTLMSIKMNNQTSASSTQMPGMQTMMYIMPVMFMFFLNNFSAALTYYYFLTNVITFGQNYLFKKMINEEELLAKLNENKKKPVKKSRFQMALEEAAKRQQAGKQISTGRKKK